MVIGNGPVLQGPVEPSQDDGKASLIVAHGLLKRTMPIKRQASGRCSRMAERVDVIKDYKLILEITGATTRMHGLSRHTLCTEAVSDARVMSTMNDLMMKVTGYGADCHVVDV